MAQPMAQPTEIPQATVAIGMPVYNGERHLRESVESLLAQTWRDFVLVISDNASTDGTARIARELAARDARVHYVRNDTNVGVFRNYDLAFARTRSTYFKWAAANDLCAPRYLEACVAALEADPAIALAYPGTILFTDDPARGTRYELDPDVRDADPVTRFERLLGALRLNNAFNGLYRADALRRTSLNGEYMGSDIVVVAEIALMGHVARLPEYLFYRRMTPEAASAARDPDSRRDFFAGTGRDVHGTPTLDKNLQLIRAVRATALSASGRRRAWRYLLRRLWWGRRDMLAETRHLLARTIG
jgi:glycosyltransferase involved in cell wall biosynthesis